MSSQAGGGTSLVLTEHRSDAFTVMERTRPAPGPQRRRLPGSRTTSDWIFTSAALVLTSGLVVDQLRVVVSFGQSHADEDQTLLWDAGRALLGGHLYQPNFYGQTYNTVFEAFPGALLHLVGLPWGAAMPVATSMMVTLAWVALAVGAFRKGHQLVALLALAAPLIMRVQYLLLFDAPRGVMAGDLAAATAVAIALGARRHRTRLGALVAIGGTAVLWDVAAAFLIIPVLVYVVGTDWAYYRSHFRSTGALVGLAALPPVAWLFFSEIFYRSHRDDRIAPTVSMLPHWSVFVDNVGHLDAYVSFFAPALAPMAQVAALILLEGFVTLVVVCLRRRAYPLLVAGLSLLVLVFLALSLDRASEVTSGLYLSASRLLLPLPFALWFLVYGVSDSVGRATPQARRVHAPSAVALVALAVVSLVATQLAFTNVANRAVRYDMQERAGVSEVSPQRLTAVCTGMTRVYDATRAQLLATVNPDIAYGCAAEDGINTLVTELERRGWVLQASLNQKIGRVLIAVSGCRFVSPLAGRCTDEAAGLVLLQTPPTPAARTLDRITGFHVHMGENPLLSDSR
jgi:hypothetical protein